MNTIEKLISKIFDKTITAFGLMTNKISDSITSDLSDGKFRDECAMKAMQGILASQVHFRGNGATNAEKEAIEIAKESYLIAKAMLKVRKEVNNG
ncbi:hypothetical protein [Sphingobacterium anhuiense]|uniref:hypothetical protein n=1 Tax=Sphingobacterium anhuiense TaxID=493780 RepID=UPI003C2AEC87